MFWQLLSMFKDTRCEEIARPFRLVASRIHQLWLKYARSQQGKDGRANNDSIDNKWSKTFGRYKL